MKNPHQKIKGEVFWDAKADGGQKESRELSAPRDSTVIENIKTAAQKVHEKYKNQGNGKRDVFWEQEDFGKEYGQSQIGHETDNGPNQKPVGPTKMPPSNKLGNQIGDICIQFRHVY